MLSGASGMLGTALRDSLDSRGATILQLLRRAPETSNQFQWNPSQRSNSLIREVFEDLIGRYPPIRRKPG